MAYNDPKIDSADEEQGEAPALDKPARPTTGSIAKHASVKAQRRAAANWMRLEYVLSRGHREWVRQALRCEDFYLGAGLQWHPSDVAKLAEEDRRTTEDNQVMPMVNTAIGYQIANRMEIGVRPRGRGADDVLADAVGKVLKYMADSTQLHWRETEVFGHGMIMSGRGYFDIRMSFERNALGDVDVSVPDPIDVIPDPDAADYDPEKWADVTVVRYYTLDQIEQMWGAAARKAMERFETPEMTVHGSVGGSDLPRASFGADNAGSPAYFSESGDVDRCALYKVADRQYRVYELTDCIVWPTGEIDDVSMATPAQRESYQKQGCLFVRRMHKRVRWCVSSRNVLLFDDYSPYPWFTIVPFFPFFRRGRTRGLVDNAISPQETLNKGLSQLSHILNTVAHSGYYVEEKSLTQSIEQFKQDAAKNGLVIEYKRGFAKPERITPGQVPSGIVEFIAQAKASLVSSTGMDEALTSSGPMNEMSGVAYQARQYAAQQKLAVPLDNLGRTRYMVGHRFLDLLQMFYDTPRVIRITEQDAFGNPITNEVALNDPVEKEDGSVEYLNDLTVGEYDLVITEQPMQITFDNSNFEQVKSLATDFGYRVPAPIAVRYMNIADKAEIAKAIDQQNQQQVDPLNEAKANLAKAQADKVVADTVTQRITAVYEATQAGAQIATIPQVAGLADEILQSAGFVDQNAAPIVPEVAAGAGLAQVAPAQPTVEPGTDLNGPAPTNTHPLTPASPAVGKQAGIEAPGVQ